MKKKKPQPKKPGPLPTFHTRDENDSLPIVDPTAYAEFKKLDSIPLLHQGRIVRMSDGNNISLGIVAIAHFERKIKHLPEAEQKQLWAKKKVYQQLIVKRNGALKRAYGTVRVNRHGEKTRPMVRPISMLETRRKEIIQLFGRLFSVQEVHEICLKEFKLDITYGVVLQFRQDNFTEIDMLVEEYKRTYSDIRLGYKRSRMEELSWLYHTRKRIYEQTKRGDDHRLLLMTIEQIRKEAEGDVIRMDGNININIDVAIEEQIRKDLYKLMPLKELIISKIGAKTGVGTQKLITQLHTSHYSQFLQRLAVDTEYEDLPKSPVEEVYDFDKINRIHQQQDKNGLISALSNANAADADSMPAPAKNLLLEKIRKQQEALNYQRNNLTQKSLDREAERIKKGVSR